MSSLGAPLWLGYCLNRHKVGPVPLSGLALMAGALAWGGAWKGWLSLVQVAVISTICWALAGIGLRARWQGYLRFRAEDTPPPRHVSPPLPEERVPLRASGRFEVMHKGCDFIGAQTAFSTMDSGEHVIMAYIPRSRFLLLGQWPSEEVGWWYIFLSPRPLGSITPGQLLFGPRPRPALQIRHWSNRGGEQRVHLAFTDQEQRAHVWAGLRKGANSATLGAGDGRSETTIRKGTEIRG